MLYPLLDDAESVHAGGRRDPNYQHILAKRELRETSAGVAGLSEHPQSESGLGDDAAKFRNADCGRL